MVYHWSLSDSKSPQISKILFHILADLNKAVVCIVSCRSLIPRSSSPSTNLLVTIPRAPITTDIVDTLVLHIFSVLK